MSRLTHTRRWTEESGVVLPMTLMFLMILSTLAAALLTVGSLEVQTASNHLRATQALFVAEAGLEDAFNAFRTDSTRVTAATSGLTVVPGLAGPGANLAAFGTYAVTYQSAGPDTVRVVSRGTTPSGGVNTPATRTLTTVFSTTFTSTDAIRTRLNLTISGNPIVSGLCGSVHANGGVNISGNPTLSGTVTATGTLTNTGNGTMAAGSGGGRSPKPIPTIDPAAFLTRAKSMVPPNELFQFRSNGQVLNGTDTVIAMLSPGQEFRGWKYNAGSPTKWDFSANTGYNGTYYLEGNAVVSGNPGTTSTPWVTTLLATGDIEISGTPVIKTALRDTLFVAGKDVKINGNPDQSFEGLIAAHEQVGISGNPNVNGYIIAEEKLDTSGTVTGTGLSGNPTITYNCGLNPPLAGPLQVLVWGL